MFVKLFLMLVALCMATGTAAVVRAGDGDRLAKFQQFAAEPVEQIQYWQLIGFETLEDDTVAVWTGVNRVYLIKVQQPCPRFEYAMALGLAGAQAHVISARFDAVTFDGQRCAIDTIRPVDYRAMRNAKQASAQVD